MGSGAELGDLLVQHPRTRFILTTARAAACASTNSAAKTQLRPDLIKRVVAEMGGKDAIVVDEEADLTAVQVCSGPPSLPRPEMLGSLARHIVAKSSHDLFLDKLQAKAPRSASASRKTFSPTTWGPVINERSRQSILATSIGQVGYDGSSPAAPLLPARATSSSPPSSPTLARSHASFQEEIFGPVLAVTKARDFEHRASEIANDQQAGGLTGAVYTLNQDKIREASAASSATCTSTASNGAMVGAHLLAVSICPAPTCVGGLDYLLMFAGQVDRREDRLRFRED